MKTNNVLRKYLVKTTILVFTFFTVYSCADKEVLSQSLALDAVESYLQSNPIYETTTIEIGDIKFKQKKDSDKLKAYKELSDKGYLTLTLTGEKKKFLSKDSVFTYMTKLTDKASLFVVKQKEHKVEVKTVEYKLNTKEKGTLEVSGKRSGKITLTFKKFNTDFSTLTEDKNPHTPFITKTFKLRYNKGKGWEVTK